MVLADEDAGKLAEMKAKLNLSVPFIADSGGKVGQEYGLVYTAGDHDGHVEPGVFVLAPNRTLAAGSYVTGPHGRMPVEGALRLVTMMKSR